MSEWERALYIVAVVVVILGVVVGVGLLATSSNQDVVRMAPGPSVGQ